MSYLSYRLAMVSLLAIFSVLSVSLPTIALGESKLPLKQLAEVTTTKQTGKIERHLSAAEIKALLLKSIPNVKIKEIVQMPQFGGLYWVTLDDFSNLFVSPDGKEFILGQHFGIDSKGKLSNLSESKQRVQQFQLVSAIPQNEMIIFPATDKKGKNIKSDKWIIVFTDIDCGYCRKLHNEIDDFTSAGIEVRYIFFPRTGLNTESYNKAVNVWCAEDQQAAMTTAKAGLPIAVKKCKNPVKSQFEVGVKSGVSGTPTIWTYNGKRIGGYVPLAKMLNIMQS